MITEQPYGIHEVPETRLERRAGTIPADAVADVFRRVYTTPVLCAPERIFIAPDALAAEAALDFLDGLRKHDQGKRYPIDEDTRWAAMPAGWDVVVPRPAFLGADDRSASEEDRWDGGRRRILTYPIHFDLR